MAELLKLRGKLARLRCDSQELAQLKTAEGKAGIDPIETEMKSWLVRPYQLKQRLGQMRDKQIPELEFLTQKDWFDATREASLAQGEDYRKAFRELRSVAKGQFAAMLSGALSAHTKANNGQLPPDVSQLKSYVDSPVDDAILKRYEMLQAGSLSDAHRKWLVAEKAPVVNDYGTRYYISTSGRQRSDVSAYFHTDSLPQ